MKKHRIGSLLAFAFIVNGVDFRTSYAMDVKDIKTLAIVSAIGDTLALTTSGFFSDHEFAVPIIDWKVDDFVQSTIKDEIGSRYRMLPITYDARAFDAAPGRFTLPLASIVSRLTNALGPSRQELPDAYLVIVKSACSNGGHGIRISRGNSSPFGAEKIVRLDVCYIMAAISAGENPRILASGLGKAPFFPLEDTAWTAPDETLTDAQRQRILQAIHFQLQGSLESTLREDLHILP